MSKFFNVKLINIEFDGCAQENSFISLETSMPAGCFALKYSSSRAHCSFYDETWIKDCKQDLTNGWFRIFPI